MNIGELENYLLDLDDFDKSIVKHRLENESFEEFFEKQLLYLDCSRIYPSGLRAMQTIGYPYMKEVSVYVYVLGMLEDENLINLYSDKLINIHNTNIQYEKEHPPVWYDSKKKNKWNKPKTERKAKEPKESKPTKAVQKAAQKIQKINMLSFKFKKQ